MFEIIKNLPIPEKVAKQKHARREPKYPFKDMEIGDCLAFNAEGVKDPVYKKIYGSAMSYARRIKEGYTFRFGQIEEGKFGFWKIESEKNKSVSNSSDSSSSSSKLLLNINSLTNPIPNPLGFKNSILYLIIKTVIMLTEIKENK
jgi:hypothetical protein